MREIQKLNNCILYFDSKVQNDSEMTELLSPCSDGTVKVTSWLMLPYPLLFLVKKQIKMCFVEDFTFLHSWSYANKS